jgi:hypothetical protein
MYNTSLFLVICFTFVIVSGSYIYPSTYTIQFQLYSGDFANKGIFGIDTGCNYFISDFVWKYTIINESYINLTSYVTNYCQGSEVAQFVRTLKDNLFNFDK